MTFEELAKRSARAMEKAAKEEEFNSWMDMKRQYSMDAAEIKGEILFFASEVVGRDCFNDWEFLCSRVSSPEDIPYRQFKKMVMNYLKNLDGYDDDEEENA